MKQIIVLALLTVPEAVHAEVRSSTSGSFEIQSIVTVSAAPAEAYAMLGRIGEWWDPAHSYSGKAANLSLGLKAGDCFCERMDDGGSIEHLRVVHVQPGRMLRLQGGLGPLQAEAVAGTLTWSLKAVTGGTEITQTYKVAGLVRGGANGIAPAVDRVLAEQLGRLKARLGR